MYLFFLIISIVTACNKLACDTPDTGTVVEPSKVKLMSINSDNSKVKKNNVRIIMTFGKHKIEIKMHDNPSSRDFLNQLPMTLKFSDYEGTEKIANLKKKLSTAGSYSGFDPSIGDVTYYAPWGNIAIFYKDFGYAKGLIPLGVIECGLNDLSHLTKNIIVHVSKIENK